MRFGQRSEALAAAGQRELFEETFLADRTALEKDLAQAERALKPKAPRKPRARAGRQPLPRVEHRHIRPQYACRHCETVVAAPVPPAIIDELLPLRRIEPETED